MTINAPTSPASDYGINVASGRPEVNATAVPAIVTAAITAFGTTPIRVSRTP